MLSSLLLLTATSFAAPIRPIQRDVDSIRTAGWGYVRMHNPGILEALSQDLESEQGQSVRSALFPGGSKSRLKKITRMTAPVSSGPKVMKIKNVNAEWSNAFVAEREEAELKLGVGYLGGDMPTSVYHGIAAKMGRFTSVR